MAVPPTYATRSGFPLSFTSKRNDSPGGVTGGRDDLHRGVADREFQAVGAHGVALRLAACTIRRFVDGIPVRTAVHEVGRWQFVLKESRAAVVVGVGVRQDDVLDLVDVEAKFSHPLCDLVRRGVVEEGFEDNDAVAADESPGVVDLGPYEIEVVRYLRGLGVPGALRRRS